MANELLAGTGVDVEYGQFVHLKINRTNRLVSAGISLHRRINSRRLPSWILEFMNIIVNVK
ncbi:MAG: hypothetical protein KA398_01770 [Bacteroides sp.]|nr:hypothetical protein [Bacteroides sp.]